MNRMDQENIPQSSSCASVHRNYSSDDEIDLRELVKTIWQGKFVIGFSVLVCTCITIAYAMCAQEWWTAKAKVTAPLIQDYSEYFNSVSRLQSIVAETGDIGSRQAQSATEEHIANLDNSKYIFNEFIKEFNSVANKKAFLSQNAEYRELAQGITEDQLLKLNAEWFDRILAKQENTKQEDSPYILSFQAKDRKSSVAYLNDYIAMINEKSRQVICAELISLAKAQLIEFEQKRAISLIEANETLKLEIVRAESALKIAQVADVKKPVQTNNEEVFSIEIGAPALAQKVNVLRNFKELSVFQPQLAILNAKIAVLNQLKVDKNMQFSLYRLSDEIENPLNRDKPKRSLIVVLGTLLGGMLGVAFVLVRHAFDRKEETV